MKRGFIKMKIGFFDSGIGGLSVLNLALKRLPNEQFIFYADESHVPYGEKTQQQIIEYTDIAVQFMLDLNVKAIVIACNTATSAAIKVLREKYTVPIIGMEPAVKKAIDIFENKKVLVTATPLTVKGKKMQKLIERVDNENLVDLVPLPKLVRFAEKGEFESKEVIEYLENKLNKFDLKDYSSIVLGCTHFNYFKDSFRKVIPPHVKFVDGNEGTINRLIQELNYLINDGADEQTVEYYYSGDKVTDAKELMRLDKCLERLDGMLQIK
jgi:glutamate racemase